MIYLLFVPFAPIILGMYYFGTDGIRDKATSLIDGNIPYLLGRALSLSGGKILVAKDVRESSNDIEKMLCKGLLDGDCSIYLCGIMPTPALSYIASKEKADYAVMITASHNPPEYNGLKVFAKNGKKLSKQEEIAIDNTLHELKDNANADYSFIDEMVCADSLALEQENIPLEVANHRINIIDNALHHYITHIKKMFPRFDNIKVRLDLANGCLCKVAKEIFSSLGCDVTTICDNLNGNNINVDCGSTNIDNLLGSIKQDEIGFAFDGDGDRVITVVDNKVYDGDAMLLALSSLYRIQGKLRSKFVVGTIMTNTRLQRELAYHNTALIRADVGDKNVLDEMANHNSILGGEQSGHIIMSDKSSTGDGIITALSLLEVKKVIGSFPKYTPYPTLSINIPLSQFDDILLSKKVEEAQALTKNSRLVVRKSGTEPVIRITYECQERYPDKYFDKVKEIFDYQ